MKSAWELVLVVIIAFVVAGVALAVTGFIEHLCSVPG